MTIFFIFCIVVTFWYCHFIFVINIAKLKGVYFHPKILKLSPLTENYKSPILLRDSCLRVPSKIENVKSNFFLVHGVPFRLKWRVNLFFLTKILFSFLTKLKANSVCLHFSPKPFRSALTWRQSEKCKICVRIPKMNMCLQLSLRSSYAGMFLKQIRPQKQPSACIF